ncbi:MAG: ion transporter [Pseudomonadota bacterium]|nr:ion transporter [Pseudomonadota bacterium]
MVRPVNLANKSFTGLRGKVASLVERNAFVNGIAAVILLNAVTLGLETDDHIRAEYGAALHVVDLVILGIFVIEILLKLFAYRLSFFRAGWNVFDFGIVAIALIPAAGAFSILRAMRIFRMLRLLSIVPSMRRVITALLNAVPGMLSILGIMMIIFYSAAVMATKVFGGSSDPLMQEMFGSMGDSMFTLFQVMTLEDWPDVAGPTMVLFPWAWVFFVTFIVVTSFAVLNLFVGIIVDAMDIIHDFEEEGKGVKDFVHKENEDIRNELDSLRGDMAEIKSLLVAASKK